ncbi:sporulation lipoprotein, YhcN/YlaJ family [Gracilibacillus orientalis]|uniref:Sporulation lipoprotein, YhcN/YlaJ family n=1 Tax=Gracilibacillus orientalis TaxID=334253 RepID=A0A1I4HHC6_9BACI|nr:YhcN/YlaJ family sporulation lipoprotein [Gracilibacillus orientalis]SFL41615.1 sporulation lipoprotein, YhcN/YlaJ family [Gracilibacillus orientalis]
MKLSKPALAMTFAATLTLTACGGNEYGQENGEYNGNPAQPIGYNQTSNDPANDRANNRNQTTDPSRGQDNMNRETRRNDNNQFMFDGNTNRDADNMTNSRRNGANYNVGEEAAEKIQSEVPEIDRVYVVTTDNNAYVAASWDKETDNESPNRNNEELSEETKEKITKTVKSVNDDIDNVYVSTNPDFFDLAGQYANDVEGGEPVEGFFKRMGNMIERVFPNDEE